MGFKIVHNLDGLSSTQLQEYVRDASVFFKLDPDLGLLDTIWMKDDTTGMGKLVLYVRRGAAEVLRDIHGISVLSSVRKDSPDEVTFEITGKNPSGRQEVGCGSHSIKGLSGEKLSTAIMTAHTRALRRLTLQFVGGGLLDESEVTPFGSISPASVAELAGSAFVIPPMPKVTINNEVGKAVEKTEPVPEKKVRGSLDIGFPKSSEVSVPLVAVKEPEERTVDTGEPRAFPLADAPKPTTGDQAKYKAKLREYSTNILPKAGLVPSVGIGGVSNKIRLFVAAYLSLQPNVNPTNEQWEVLFNYFDSFVGREKELVNLINERIGAK